jgi:ribosomal protein S18 acetylase RimI-like enzyme
VLRLETVGDDEWQRWRAVRLRALAEAPYAFGSTLAEWAGPRDLEQLWRDRLLSVPYNVLAILDDDVAGMVSATAVEDGEVELISMWVSPLARGRGVGDALIDGVLGHARDSAAARVVLDVRANNRSAIALYERHGFRSAGPSTPPDDPFPEIRMVRLLASD